MRAIRWPLLYAHSHDFLKKISMHELNKGKKLSLTSKATSNNEYVFHVKAGKTTVVLTHNQGADV